MKKKVVIIGGGAAGFFAAITIAEANLNAEVILLEKNKSVLQKVKVSGGGRCNVTHACFTPNELIEFYPRGKKELLGPFHRFMTGDTMEWFENRGVPLKIEEDNRVFPISNSSDSIVNCLMQAAEDAGVILKLGQKVLAISKENEHFMVASDKGSFNADKLLVTSGSNANIWQILNSIGHKIIPAVPSLFTFKINDARLKDIPGISVPEARVFLRGTNFEAQGPLLITHWGISGPAVLKLSSIAAHYLAQRNYIYEIELNWVSKSTQEVIELLKEIKNTYPKKNISLKPVIIEMPKRLWEKLVEASQIKREQRWADLSNKKLENLANQLTKSIFIANGKATNKEEFVTAGGVELKEVDFKRFESRIHKNLFFAGEVLNIDAVTGGFNFQNAWTGAFIAGNAMANDKS